MNVLAIVILISTSLAAAALILRMIKCLSRPGRTTAYAARSFIYQKPCAGYTETAQNIHRAKNAAVQLGLATAAAGGKISRRQIEIIEDWRRENVDLSGKCGRFRLKIFKFTARIAGFFPDYNRTLCEEICQRITEDVPLKIRCDIFEMCLHVTAANGRGSIEQLVLLKNIAEAAGICRDRFREMMEKTLPVSMYAVDDMEINLGITPDMDKPQACRQLNREYRKWNARVTNRNPAIKKQAEGMLEKIALARERYKVQPESYSAPEPVKLAT